MLFRLASDALERAGARRPMAEAAARHLVAAEAQGLSSHGLARVPFYCTMLASGRADGAAVPRLVVDGAATCLIDNADALPFEACARAVAEALARARRHGIGLAGVCASGHAGVLGLHLAPLVEADCVGVAFSNSPAAIPPWGGARAVFGTNPVAFAFPRPQADPIVVDLALSTVVRGRLMLAAERGEAIPEGWALDRSGRPTTDAREAIEHGSLFPIGGAKGAALALAFELFVAALTGSAIGVEADSFFAERGNRPRIGQLFLAVDPDRMAGHARYRERVESLVAAVLAQGPQVRVPGARRFASARAAERDGLELPEPLVARLEQLAGRR